MRRDRGALGLGANLAERMPLGQRLATQPPAQFLHLIGEVLRGIGIRIERHRGQAIESGRTADDARAAMALRDPVAAAAQRIAVPRERERLANGVILGLLLRGRGLVEDGKLQLSQSRLDLAAGVRSYLTLTVSVRAAPAARGRSGNFP